MKLVRFGEPGCERPGVWMDDGRILDVRASAFHIADFDGFFWEHHGVEQLRSLCVDPSARFVAADGVRLGPPVARPSQIICIGANYAAHAAEFGHVIPSEPLLFAKATSSLNGPFDPIVLPDSAPCVDAEVELAVVIGKPASRIPMERAMDVVAGFTVLNDVTERVAQRTNGQWFRGKSFDTFCPVGPWVVTPDDIPDLGALRLWNRLDGTLLQEDFVCSMLFSVPHLIAFISAGITLHPGDLIATGTPSGIGSAHHPPRLIQPGSLVEVGIDGLGAQRSPVQAARTIASGVKKN